MLVFLYPGGGGLLLCQTVTGLSPMSNTFTIHIPSKECPTPKYINQTKYIPNQTSRPCHWKILDLNAIILNTNL